MKISKAKYNWLVAQYNYRKNKEQLIEISDEEYQRLIGETSPHTPTGEQDPTQGPTGNTEPQEPEDEDPNHDYSKDYLTFEALEDGTFSFINDGLSYSIDNGNTWNELPAEINTPIIKQGEKIIWKNNKYMTPYNNSIGTFISSGKFNISGNIMSIKCKDNFYNTYIYSDDNIYDDSIYFTELFKNCKLINSNNLILPNVKSNNISNFMFYTSMFEGCTLLVNAPKLPTLILYLACYQRMFKNCISLIKAPELPATTLASNCYSNMFYGCTSLTTAPELPAQRLAWQCYYGMFYGCTSLTTAPELPATKLTNGCYIGMFQDCTSLNYVKCLAKYYIETCFGEYSNFGLVTKNGVFIKHKDVEYPKGVIPEGWEIIEVEE